MQELKAKYIPLCCSGELSIRKCADLLGIAPVSVFNLKKRYEEKGELAFVNGHKGKKYPSKLTDDLVNNIIVKYHELYSDKEFVNENAKEFYRILVDNYNFSISYANVLKILKTINDRELVSNKYLRSNSLDYSDFFKLYNLISEKISLSKYSNLEKFGLVYLCEILFDKSFYCLKKKIKKQSGKNFRTSHSLFEYIISSKKININTEWKYWLENHKFFTFIYDEKVLEKVISDIQNIYFGMFKRIYDYLNSCEQ